MPDTGKAVTSTSPQGDPRPFEDLSESGLLWLINRSVFHPRGFALGLVKNDDGRAVGWTLAGDGCEPWWFDPGTETETFNAAQATFAEASGASR